MDNYKSLYSKSLKQLGETLHFVAHSHHLWPDASLFGQGQYWLDSIKLNDAKWEYIFKEILPKTQAHIAKLLNVRDPNSIVMAPNTHEFILRILSLFPANKKIKILTTDSEFYSFDRQIKRLEEENSVEVQRISTDVFISDRENFIQKIKSELQTNQYDLFFISQVFFNSGLALSQLEIESLMRATPDETLFVLDGYHGFAALPIDLSHLSKRIFYLAGGYKYAQAGEGMGFMVVPEGDFRPRNTGWFAELALLTQNKSDKVLYPEGAQAFAGATIDPSSWYRFNAVWDEFLKQQIHLEQIHAHVKKLQKIFLENFKVLSPIYDENFEHGHFLTYKFASDDDAKSFVDDLKKQQILVDRRGSRVRFGFGIYQNETDLEACLQRLKNI